MRAGLLSDPRVIKLINDKFVSTWILRDDVLARIKKGDKLAKQLDGKFQFPIVDFMFLTPDGKFINKLNSFFDFPMVHPDVSSPLINRKDQRKLQSHVDVFLEHVAKHFGTD